MEILEAKRIMKEMATFCSYKLRTFLSFDDVEEITQQILSLPEEETRDFIRAYINPDKSKQKQVNSFINELLSKKRKYNSLIEQDQAKRIVLEHKPIEKGLTAYIKERPDELAPGVKKKKAKRDRKSKQQRQMENKEVKFVRKFCDCQALLHPLVNNCLQCGKIICEKEGEGPCMFCGAAEEAAQNSSEIQKATEHRDKLIGYERNSKITKVYDDQADHFDYHGNQWLSENEKALLKKRQDDNDSKIREEQRNIVVTFDIAGRQIIQEENRRPVPTEENEEDLLDPFSIGETDRKAGTFQNPFLQASKPTFRKSNRPRPKDFLDTEEHPEAAKQFLVQKTNLPSESVENKLSEL